MCSQQQWEAKTLRVVEIRKCSLTYQKNNDPSWCEIAVVLGTFSENFPQQRFLTMHVKDLCRFVREGFPISRSGSDREEEDGEMCGFQFKDSFNIFNEEVLILIQVIVYLFSITNKACFMFTEGMENPSPRTGPRRRA